MPPTVSGRARRLVVPRHGRDASPGRTTRLRLRRSSPRRPIFLRGDACRLRSHGGRSASTSARVGPRLPRGAGLFGQEELQRQLVFGERVPKRREQVQEIAHLLDQVPKLDLGTDPGELEDPGAMLRHDGLRILHSDVRGGCRPTWGADAPTLTGIRLQRAAPGRAGRATARHHRYRRAESARRHFRRRRTPRSTAWRDRQSSIPAPRTWRTARTIFTGAIVPSSRSSETDAMVLCVLGL